MDTRELRNALGCFPTGIAVIATYDQLGNPVGFTANSVTPVSMEIPRILWSLATGSRNRVNFEANGYFSINILRDTQIDIARRMSGSAIDRFAEISWQPNGVDCLPKIEGCIAWLGCRLFKLIEAGDHIAFLGDVLQAEQTEGLPLLYVNGQYSGLLSPNQQLLTA